MPPSCFPKMLRRLLRIEHSKENTMENQMNEVELDLLELLRYLKKKIWIIAIVVAVCACIAFCGTKFFMTPEYTASTRMYVLNRSSEVSVVYSDFQTSTQLVNDYEVLITGRNVTEEVISQLGLSMSAGQLSGMIQVSSPSGTRVLQISVTDTDPKRAADIANAVREVAADQIQSIMDVDAVKDVYEAVVPGGPSGPNVERNTSIGAIVGLVVSVVFFTVIFLLDDTIRTEDDVQYYLGLSVLGVIPATEDISVSVGRGHGKIKIAGSNAADGKKK